ncbi:MAG TPA: hypothetical protein VHJ83_13255 [Micromonosporaceae bacterium]|jgi:asparagine synthase (glutamine-hydrolysing)|nr:hypothetical protein [Micromonosporaceae bacterium]
MLAFRLHWPDLNSGLWCERGGRWGLGRSWIAPYQHPALTTGLVNCPDGAAVFWVAEHPGIAVKTPSTASEVVAELVSQGMEFAVFRIERDAVRLTVGPHGTAPIYLAHDGNNLAASWDLADLSGWCHADRLVDRVVAGILTRRYRYTSQTVFSDVRCVTERGTVVWDGSRCRIEYPQPGVHVLRARRLRSGVDPVKIFGGLLTDLVSRRALPGLSAVELSGGVDSANVAISLAGVCPGPHSIGIVLDGRLGEQQASRRRELVRRFGFRDAAVFAVDHPPFAVTGLRTTGQLHSPAGDFYLEAFTALAGSAAARGVRVLFTGLGGDEAMALRPDERDCARWQPPYVPWLGSRAVAALADLDTDTAPVAPVPLPSLMGFAARNPTYLRAGIWPVSPLADPLAVRLAESLPVNWRRRKRLLRHRLASAGMPAEVVDPAEPENFLPLMQQGLSRFGLPYARRMIAGSLLIDSGFVDPIAFRHVVEQAERADCVPNILYDTIALEMSLRSMPKDHT